ncbi:Protein kinase domain-containing protein [Aphelenchoides besseyi]|nr:Protein kinase domain-containing protein [Aphelenchoides besseyi]
MNLRIETDRAIGSGVSATVYKGHLKKDQGNGSFERVVVAAKFAHTYSSQSSKKAMMREIELMKTLKPHINIIKFYGCILKIEQPAVITEFCVRNDLLKHLRAHKLHFLTDERCDEVEVCLLLPDLLQIASEVCSAMVHLSSLGLVHRDLAARNVFLTDDLTAKVGDCGLCCPIDKITREEKLPVTHMAFESLKFGEFSEKSDVWSFGCLIFEMFNGGQRPFSDFTVDELVSPLEEDRKPRFSEDA